MTVLLDCINKKTKRNCIWLMRQAGRYLPEFRKIRSQNLDFIKLCLNEDLSSEITIQPLKRFEIDAAIIFSDILLVPYALGQEVKFVKDHGPELSKFNLEKFLDNNEINFTKKLKPVYEAISKTRKKLDKKKSLISLLRNYKSHFITIYSSSSSKNIGIIDIQKEIFNLTKIP